jgi:DNA polymerase-4
MPLRSLVIDFNSYFASVEQQENPSLRGKPVAIVQVMAETTSCIAASYEAKKYGVKTGTQVKEARKLCPGLNVVPARHKTYIEYHHNLIKVVDSCLPVDKVLSIDEMLCLLIGSEQKKENAIQIALKIKDTIAEEVGGCMRCSIGIAPNQFLAKTASDMEKPDGLIVIEESDLPACLYRLKINDFVGIGRQMEPRLRAYGIDTAEKLCNASKALLKKVWGGIEGERMFDQLRGIAVNRPPTHKTVISHSNVLSPEFRTDEGAHSVLHRLIQKAATRLRNAGYVCGAVSIIVKFIDGRKWRYETSISHTQDTLEFIRIFEEMWRTFPLNTGKPIYVSAGLFKLMYEDQNTEALFGDYDKSKSLNSAVDLLNRKFGYGSAYFAGSHTAKDSAPTRIAFSQIPDLETENDGIDEE